MKPILFQSGVKLIILQVVVLIGVVKDYHFESLTKKIEPQQHVLAKGYNQYFLFRVKGGKMQSAITKIEKVYREVFGDLPYEYTFLDEDSAHMSTG